MSTEKMDRQRRISELFERAVRLPLNQRSDFLVQACGEEAALREELESLVRHHEQSPPGFLSPAVRSPVRRLDLPPLDAGQAGAPPNRAFEPPIDSIEGYQITKELHRGGQGVVYQAIQKSTRRKVALKVMLEGPFASEKTKRRFEREVELIASLHHPNIVSVFDTGVSHGKYWFAMDYIRGRPLDQYAAGKDLSIERALQLFAKICEAVNYAHQRGVIHRDLKPGNIMVDDQGEPHVLDFGLAKVAGAEAFGDSRPMLVSVTGQVVGTLPYMSPEQAKGDPSQIDIRTDVYSLGVMLYELLTGKYPYVVVGQMADVLHNIQEAEPRRPSTIRRQIKNELETVLLKALAKDRQRRYQSAAELGRDLQHYLSGAPIEAKRDSGLYLLKKSLSRHRRPLAAGAVVLCLLIAVGGVSLWKIAQIGQSRATEESRRVLQEAWSLARERGDLRGALTELERFASPRVTSADYFLVKGAITTSCALEAHIDDKPGLTRQAIAEFQDAHAAAGGQRFWDGSSVLNSFSENQSAGSASALRAAAGLVMLNDWESSTRQENDKLATDAWKLYSAAEQVENRMGKSMGAAWDPVPPAFNSARDPLTQKKLHEESPAEARQRADENAEIVRLIANPVESLVRGSGQRLESRFVTELVFDDLFALNQELHLVANDNLVSAVGQDPNDRRRWTIDLNAAALWHDGVPLTADDVEFSWKTFCRSDDKRLESVTAEGSHRVRIIHKGVCNTARHDMRIAVYPKHIWAHLALLDKQTAIQQLDENLGSHPIGNGPFLLESLRGSRIVLTRWEKYSGQRPMIRRITFEVDSSRSSRARKLAEGRADTGEMKAEDYYWHVNGASFADRVTKVRHDKYEYDFIMWNLRKESLLTKPELRMAIAHAVDLAALRRFLYCGVYEQCLGIFQGQAIADSRSGGDLGYDPRRAGDLLAAAFANENIAVGASSMSAGETKLTINLLVPNDNLSPRLAARVLRKQAMATGIDLQLHERPYRDCIAAFKLGVEKVGGSTLVFHGIYSGVQRFGDPADDADRWRSDGPKNYGHYSNKDVDDLLDWAASAMELEKEGEYYRSAQRIVFGDQPYLFLWQKPGLWAFSDRLRGIKLSKMGPALFYPGPRAWWVPGS
jgi:serine/threonine protein kinase/ABC-type transport system substrate-binding protein